MFNKLETTAASLAAAVAATLALGAAAPAFAADAPVAPAPAAADARPLVDGRFTVEVVGHGPDVIVIPGLASSRDTYADFVRQDGGRHRLHLIQLAGFAGTPAGRNGQDPHLIADTAEAIAAYIRDQKLHRPAIVGHSLGGLTALIIAERHPDLISRAEIIDSFPFFALVLAPQVTVEQAAMFSAPARDAMLKPATLEARTAQAQQMASAMTTSPAHQQEVVAWSVASDQGAVARAFYEDMTTDVRPELSKITVPVKVLYAFEPAMAANISATDYDQKIAGMYAGLKGVQLVRVDDSHHFITFDQPDRFARETEAFLDGR